MKQYDVVRIIKNDNKVGITEGQIGTILEDFGDNHFEIEISDENGITIFSGEVSGEFLEVVYRCSMREKDLFEFLIFIAEEDAQISTIVDFFTNQLGYEVNVLKNIVDYGVKMDILKVIKNDEDNENCMVVEGNELNEIDWSISNVIHEIWFKNFDYYRKKLFVSNPEIPKEFRGFIKE
ncbi:DUF4926 domain-containing protein [Aquibacillus albus]|uniref:Uncharacterized protein n=1 Tax=Aquibacillus albus TaxID=1168171 RepID=A0ABS2MZN8_9BACI|nr:DUF4926 domain-containing protein [Aquibacillus albus]MBM7571332.1 hypothetical protein [Aquibacillus albus]